MDLNYKLWTAAVEFDCERGTLTSDGGLSVGPSLIEDSLHGGEGFFADVVFNAFTVDRGGLRTDAEGFQESSNHFVAFSRGGCQSFARRC